MGGSHAKPAPVFRPACCSCSPHLQAILSFACDKGVEEEEVTLQWTNYGGVVRMTTEGA